MHPFWFTSNPWRIWELRLRLKNVFYSNSIPNHNSICFPLSVSYTEYLLHLILTNVKLSLLTILSHRILTYGFKHFLSSYTELRCTEILKNISYLALLSSEADRAMRCIVAEAGRGFGSACRLGTSPEMPWRARLYLPRSIRFIFYSEIRTINCQKSFTMGVEK